MPSREIWLPTTSATAAPVAWGVGPAFDERIGRLEETAIDVGLPNVGCASSSGTTCADPDEEEDIGPSNTPEL